MLRATFQSLVRGFSARREADLWNEGILSWDDFEQREPAQHPLFPDEQGTTSPFSLPRAALRSGDMSFFAEKLHPSQHFRIPLEVPEKTMFLDIETTGLSRYYDVITLVGWSYQDEYRFFVRGQDDAELRNALSEAQVIITFNGALFDLPFLRQGFTDLRLPPVHVDLRFLAKRVGLSGGQKAIEESLGFRRVGAAGDVKGESAPVLWHRYRRGEQEALKLLVEYNHYDVEGMRFIFDKVVSRLLKDNHVPQPIRSLVPTFASRRSKLLFANCTVSGRAASKAVHLPTYEGPKGPAIKFADLFPPSDVNELRIVGIDLTGSEARQTGWCLLEGNEVSTRCIRTDTEIIDATIQTKPLLISIDSPLSLPRGRTLVSDDDPGRQEFGIMRSCERMLKKRGINAYPALIPSMQKLTARGIKLAAHFRSAGIPVIESYPGAAQDIMGIPRKRASLEMLTDGLKEFGVTGNFLDQQITHDELDAITSAIVGIFFWAGRFEALGSEADEALIIPDLNLDRAGWRGRRIIGISGHIAAGKTTAARYLEGLGFRYTRFSMVLAELLKRDGKEATRVELQAFGAEVHERYGQRWLGRRLLETVPSKGDVVIDGLRFPDDHAFLTEAFGPSFVHLHLTVPDDIRRVRFAERDSSGLQFLDASAHPVEIRVPELAALAHHKLENAATLNKLHERLRSLLIT